MKFISITIRLHLLNVEFKIVYGVLELIDIKPALVYIYRL